jgi:hypothetical protein
MGTTVLRALIPDIHGLEHTVNANIPFACDNRVAFVETEPEA